MSSPHVHLIALTYIQCLTAKRSIFVNVSNLQVLNLCGFLVKPLEFYICILFVIFNIRVTYDNVFIILNLVLQFIDCLKLVVSVWRQFYYYFMKSKCPLSISCNATYTQLYQSVCRKSQSRIIQYFCPLLVLRPLIPIPTFIIKYIHSRTKSFIFRKHIIIT